MSLKIDNIKPFLSHSLKTFLVTLLITLTGFADAQNAYSVDRRYVKKRTEKQPFTFAYPDTTIEKANRFIERNFLGNIGLSSPQYLLKFKSRSLGFKLFDLPMDDYIYRKDEIEYYQTKGPLAELSGIAGSKQLQLFRLLFSNSFKNGVNVTLKLNRYTSKGFYKQQQSFTNNFYTSVNYTSKNKRFGLTGYVLVNNNKFQENGGILKDTITVEDLKSPKELLPVKLSSAVRENKELSLQYANWFKLSKDSAKHNSFIGMHTSFSNSKYMYKDQGIAIDKYYLLSYLDTVKTNDSTRLRTFNNEINYTFRSKKRDLNFEIAYENEVAQLWQYTDTSFMNHLANLKFDKANNFRSKDSSKLIKFINSVSGSYIFSGPFAGNYKAESMHKLSFLKNDMTKAYISLRLLTEDRTPDFIFKHWYSNHFAWDNTFNKIQTNLAELSIKFNMFHVSGIYKNVFNYLYFNEQAYPMQYTHTITNLALKVGIDKVFFKHLGISASQTWQNTSSSLISLPQSVSLASLFYRGNLFKKNLQLCVGGQVEYYNEFTPYGYMPATQMFYVQDKYKAGNFTFVDVFLNARIRPVTFFLKMENVLHGLVGTNYSMVPGYYQPDRAFRCGLTWLFFD